MLILALDSATEHTSVALHDGHAVVADAAHDDGRRHAEVLAPMIARVLAEAGVEANDITVIGCGVGPGPYTGLRVGLATAVTMGAALAVPVVGVCSLDVIADRWHRSMREPLLVATDARRREVYAAVYADGQRVLGPLVVPPADAAAAAGDLLASIGAAHGAAPMGAPLTAVGSGALLYREVLAGCGVRVEEGAPGSAYPDAGVLAAMIAEQDVAAMDAAVLSSATAGLDDPRGSARGVRVPLGLLPPRPLYLRRPDAAEPVR